MILANVNGKNYIVKTYQNTPVLTLRDIDHFHDYMEGTRQKLFDTSKHMLSDNEDYFIVSKKELGTDYVTVFKLDPKDSTGILISLTGYMMLCKTMTDKRSFEISKNMLRNYFKMNSEPINNVDIQPFLDAVGTIHNENHYLLGMIEKMKSEFEDIKKLLTPKFDEVTAINNIQEWSDKTFAKVREISRAKGVYDRDVIRDICKDERFAGVDFTALKEEYTRRTKRKNPYLLKVIAATVEERKIFEIVLDEMYAEQFSKKIAEPEIVEFTAMNIAEIIQPLLEKRGDTTTTHTATYRVVYKTMNIDWDKELERYAAKNGCNKLPRKLTLIEEIPAIKDEFKKAVEKLLQ